MSLMSYPCSSCVGVLMSAESTRHLNVEGETSKRHVTASGDVLEASRDGGSEYHRSAYKLDVYDKPSLITTLSVLFSYLVLIIFGTLTDWLRARGLLKAEGGSDLEKMKDFAPLSNNFEGMFVNNIYRIASDVVNRPLVGVPGAMMRILERMTPNFGWKYEYTGKVKEVINMGSYNYLGFSHNSGSCAEAAAAAIDKYGLSACNTRHEFANIEIQQELDRRVANFLGVEDAICFPMGFGTNSMNIPAFVGKDCLILSDEFNHASIVNGSRLSGATISVFKHNDVEDMERMLISSMAKRRSTCSTPFRKILIIVEGVYSMEGTIVNLPAFIEAKKKYKAYLFIDEAHSIGALGATGRGVAEYWECDVRDIDIMMGTLTKSFAAAGGYIGGKKTLIDYLRTECQGACYGMTTSPPVAAQVITSLKIMMGDDGTNIGTGKTLKLLRNSRYLRRRLKQLGFLVYGQEDSPVIPILMFFITRTVCFGRKTFDKDLGVVSVAYPATSLAMSRARLCVSADHTKEQIDSALEIMDVVGDISGSKYGTVDHSGAKVEY